MSWMRAVAGRLKSDYRYSGSVVYNNFVWCEPTLEQKTLIEATAQAILDVRARYLGRNEELGTRNVVGTSKLVPSSRFLCSYADLYDELTMPADLRAAHKKNDLAVAKLYGMEEILSDEPAIVAELMKMYENITSAAKN